MSDEGIRAMHAELNKKREARSDAAIREVAYNCAGIGAGAIMEQAPDVVMPAGQIAAAVDALLASKLGIQAGETA